MIKECANPKCKKSFQAKRKTQKYCSGKCRKYVEKNKNVDHEKYPDVKQKYRFELLTCGLELICSRYKNECETCRQPIFGLEREI